MDSDWLACGSNGHGNLLLPRKDDIYHFTSIGLSIEDIWVGGCHIFCLLSNGTYIGSGLNQYGQLTLPSFKNSDQEGHIYPFQVIEFPVSIAKISCGWEISGILSTQGKVYMHGNPLGGRLGRSCEEENSWSSLSFPEHSCSEEGPYICDISCCESHSIALCKCGTLFGWGSNRHNALGIHTTEEFSKLQIDGRIDSYILTEPTLLRAVNQLISLNNDKPLQITTGMQFSLIRCESGRVISVGSNKYGQCAISHCATSFHSVGYNDHDKIKKNFANESVRKSRKSAGNVLGPSFIPRLRVSSISAGWNHSIAIGYMDDLNDERQDTDFVIANCDIMNVRNRRPQEKIFCWGRSNFGQLGGGLLTTNFSSSPLEVPLPALEEGSYLLHSSDCPRSFSPSTRSEIITLSTQDTVASVEGNISQSGDGNSPNNSISIHKVVAGSESSSVVLSCGCLFSWGWNEHGNLGLYDTQTRYSPELVCGKVAKIFAAGAATFIQRN